MSSWFEMPFLCFTDVSVGNGIDKHVLVFKLFRRGIALLCGQPHS